MSRATTKPLPANLPPMSADLDALNDALNDAQLSEVFAVEVAGWAIHSRNTACWVDAAERDGMMERVHAFVGELEFATSADAVLPFLEATKNWSGAAYPHARDSQAKHSVCIEFNHVGCSSTFARAACIALLRAKRAENGGAK